MVAPPAKPPSPNARPGTINGATAATPDAATTAAPAPTMLFGSTPLQLLLQGAN